MSEVRIDRAACQGAQACVRRAPATFSLDAEGKAVAQSPSPDDRATLEGAAAGCPFFAITLDDAS